MHVLVLGANGKVGSRVVAKLLEHGHAVTAGVHKNSSHVPNGVNVVVIDITNQQSMATALQNADVVVCALSTWGSPNEQILSTAMKTLIPAMQTANVKRIVSISGNVARVPGETPNIFIRTFHVIKFGIIRKVIEDSEKHISMLDKSNLDWTVIRPGIMTTANKSAFAFRSTPSVNPFVSRVAVVASIVDLVENNSHIHEAPFITNK